MSGLGYWMRNNIAVMLRIILLASALTLTGVMPMQAGHHHGGGHHGGGHHGGGTMEAVITEAVGITIIGVGIQIEGLPGELQAWQLAP